MKIKWNGHASFTITSGNGTVIVTDPYNSLGYGDEFTYEIVRDRADGAIISHEHADHSYVQELTGSPKILRGSGEINGIAITGIMTYHDDSGGSKRGKNTVFSFMVDKISICFLGDLGHMLSREQIKTLGPVDILMVPVGGTYTVDAEAANRLVDAIRPKVAIPMHFRTKKCSFPIAGVEAFLSRMKDVKRLGNSEIKISYGDLPEEGPEVWVMDHAC
jgi:L-ascorbate metabolism protein UlaG (beta-lactamase superfamily)